MEPNRELALEHIRRSDESNVIIHPHLSSSIVSVIPDNPVTPSERAIIRYFGNSAVKGHASFAALAAVAQHIQYQKGLMYGNSYRKRGELFSIFPNLCRKWDRLENLMNRLAEGKPLPEGETIVDTVMDLGIYCLLWAEDMANTRPEQFEKFIQDAANLNNG